MGTETCFISLVIYIITVEKMGPLRGDGNFDRFITNRFSMVEKMGPLRGDGNLFSLSYFSTIALNVEKMGPLRGDGNFIIITS